MCDGDGTLALSAVPAWPHLVPPYVKPLVAPSSLAWIASLAPVASHPIRRSTLPCRPLRHLGDVEVQAVEAENANFQ